jgi:hypothetical protein
LINIDAFVVSPFSWDLGQATFALKNETVFSAVQPYSPISRNEEEHDKMHSSRPNSNVTYPHSFLITPIHEIPNDIDSKIVAMLGGLFAWDYTLRNLLPNNVNGILVEIRNTCHQSHLYSLVGYDAFYLGDNATKDSMYDNMEVVRDLTYSTHPNFTTTPGHCRYSIVSIVRTFFVSKHIYICSTSSLHFFPSP